MTGLTPADDNRSAGWLSSVDEPGACLYSPPRYLLDGLPPIVQRYLRMALPRGIPTIHQVMLQQQGGMRLKKGSNQWLPFTANERFGLNPLQFIWQARMRMAALLSATVEDHYLDGRGGINARLWGVFPLVHPAHDARLDEGALLRYLAEACWFPSAMLPSSALQWHATGELSAMATLRDGHTEVRLMFYFNEQGEIARVEGLRPYLAGKKYLSRGWRGLFSEWQEFCGMRLPTQGHVFWQLDSGWWEYWRGTIDSVSCEATG